MFARDTYTGQSRTVFFASHKEALSALASFPAVGRRVDPATESTEDGFLPGCVELPYRDETGAFRAILAGPSGANGQLVTWAD